MPQLWHIANKPQSESKTRCQFLQHAKNTIKHDYVLHQLPIHSSLPPFQTERNKNATKSNLRRLMPTGLRH